MLGNGRMADLMKLHRGVQAGTERQVWAGCAHSMEGGNQTFAAVARQPTAAPKADARQTQLSSPLMAYVCKPEIS